MTGTPITTGRDAARQAAGRELTNPAYHQQQGNPLQRLLLWLWDRLGSLIDRAAGAAPGGWIGVAVGLVLVVLLAGALWWRLGRPAPRLRTRAQALFGDGRGSAAQHRAAAERFAAAGDWTAAVRERMRALVRALEEHALLDERPGRTADEAARDAGRALPDHAPELRTAARLFDDVQYGGRTAAEPDYRQLAALDQRLVHARPTAAGTPSADAGGGSGAGRIPPAGPQAAPGRDSGRGHAPHDAPREEAQAPGLSDAWRSPGGAE